MEKVLGMLRSYWEKRPGYHFAQVIATLFELTYSDYYIKDKRIIGLLAVSEPEISIKKLKSGKVSVYSGKKKIGEQW